MKVEMTMRWKGTRTIPSLFPNLSVKVVIEGNAEIAEELYEALKKFKPKEHKENYKWEII